MAVSQIPNGLNYQAKARAGVRSYINDHLEKTDERPEYHVYIVWFCKTLQNWKCLVSTTLPDQMYYEVTYNGDAKEMYIDVYKKFNNIVISDTE